MTTLISSARVSLLLVGGAAAATLSSMAGAADWQLSFQPRLDVGVSYYNLDFGSTSQLFPAGSSVSTGKLSFSDAIPTVGAGITAFADRWFFDVSGQWMFDGSADDGNTVISSTSVGRAVANVSYDTDDVSRKEYAIALGYAFADNVAVYAGYKWARTNLDDLYGSGPLGLQLADGSLARGTFSTSADYEFEYDGPFIGTTVGWAISQGAFEGRLALNAAVAFLNGTLTASSDSASARLDNGLEIPLGPGSPSEVFDSSGDSVGILIGVSWVGQTNVDGLTYSVGVNGYKYDFSADDQGKADINEAVVQFKVGLSYLF